MSACGERVTSIRRIIAQFIFFEGEKKIKIVPRLSSIGRAEPGCVPVVEGIEGRCLRKLQAVSKMKIKKQLGGKEGEERKYCFHWPRGLNKT